MLNLINNSDAYLKANVVLYPNPVIDKLLIDMTAISGSKSLRIMDVLGKIIFETEALILQM